MKSHIVPRNAFSLIELLVVIVIVAILAALLFPTLARAKAKAHSAACLNNQKQIGLSFIVWAGDHGDQFPSTVDAEEGGSKGKLTTWQHFLTISNELVTPKILHCPTDKARQVAGDFSDAAWGLQTMTNAALSYAVGTAPRSATPRMHLACDRNVLGRDGQGCGPSDIYGVITQLRVTDDPHWDGSMHFNVGNMVLADGSAHQFTRATLVRQMINPDGDPNCSLKPN